MDGANITNDVAPIEKNDRTFLTIRFIAENMGLYVDYDGKTGIVTVADRKKYFDTVDELSLIYI